MENQNIEKKLILTRPIMVNYCDEGQVNGQIVRVQMEERDSCYSDTGKRTVLILWIKVDSMAGEVLLTYMVTMSWSPKSKLFNLLDKLELMPEPGCDLDLASLEEMPVVLIVENVFKDGRTFSNIISIRKRSVAGNLPDQLLNGLSETSYE